MPTQISNASAVMVLTRVGKPYTGILQKPLGSSLLNNLHNIPIRFSDGDETTDFMFIAYFI